MTGKAIDSFSSQQIVGASLLFPGATTPDANRRVTFSGTNGTQILGVSFSNMQNLGSFELNNVAFRNNATGAVPEPMTRPTMLMGFDAIGCTMRRKTSRAWSAPPQDRTGVHHNRSVPNRTGSVG